MLKCCLLSNWKDIRPVQSCVVTSQRFSPGRRAQRQTPRDAMQHGERARGRSVWWNCDRAKL